MKIRYLVPTLVGVGFKGFKSLARGLVKEGSPAARVVQLHSRRDKDYLM